MAEELQFLEDGKTPNPSFVAPKEDNNGGNGAPNTPKTYTAEEHQAELDRVAAKTRDQAKKQSEKAIADAVKQATEEQQRLAKLSEEDKTKELQLKAQKDFEEREKTVTLRENRAIAIEKFSELKLPVKLVDFVIDLDPETQVTKTDALHEAYTLAVKDGIAEAMAGKAPRDLKPGDSSGQKQDETEQKTFI